MGPLPRAVVSTVAIVGISIRRDIAQLATDSETLHPDIAVLAVRGPAAQATAEVIVRAGIHGILNFAPIQLHVPPEVIVRAVNMAAELEVLSYALAHRGE